MSDWKFEEKVIKELTDMPKGVFGFIYRVTHKPTGKRYLGRKQLIYSIKREIGKRETKRLKEERKEKGIDGWWNVPSHKYVERESDWKDYYGSNDEIAELLEKDGPEAFEREILEFAYHKKQLTYKETRLLFEKRVLEDNSYVNSNIQGKFYPKDTVDELE